MSLDSSTLKEEIEVSKNVKIPSRDVLKAIRLIWESVEEDKIDIYKVLTIATFIVSVIILGVSIFSLFR